MRLIDADILPRHGNRGGLVHWKDIEDAPTVDGVEVIRCAECKRSGTWFGHTMKCKRWNQLVDMSFYCGDGELVEDEQ